MLDMLSKFLVRRQHKEILSLSSEKKASHGLVWAHKWAQGGWGEHLFRQWENLRWSRDPIKPTFYVKDSTKQESLNATGHHCNKV